jgi:hypothetical protein
LNPRGPAALYEPLPEIQALRLDDLGGQRAFSYGLEHSPAFRAALARGHGRLALATFFLDRQVLAPYANVIDRVEVPEATDLTGFVPRPRELGPEDYEPGRAARLVPWLRQAAVSRVLSVDPLVAPGLSEIAAVPTGWPDLPIRVYAVDRPAPRAYVACRARVSSWDDALNAPYRPGFDLGRDVVLEREAAASCQVAAVEPRESAPDRSVHVVEADGPGLFVLRDSWAPGWQASVDGVEQAVLRANGKHRAVAVPAGRHEVVLRYQAPGLRVAVLVSLVSAMVAAWVWLRDGRAAPGGRV